MEPLDLAYMKYYNALNLHNFSGAELLITTRKEHEGIVSGLPPWKLWKNLVPALTLLQRVRDHYGVPIRLYSVYRCPQYNKYVGGVTHSQHLQNRAIDFKVSGVDPREVAKNLREWQRIGCFRGGLGSYNNFTHIDTRSKTASWGF